MFLALTRDYILLPKRQGEIVLGAWHGLCHINWQVTSFCAMGKHNTSRQVTCDKSSQPLARPFQFQSMESAKGSSSRWPRAKDVFTFGYHHNTDLHDCPTAGGGGGGGGGGGEGCNTTECSCGCGCCCACGSRRLEGETQQLGWRVGWLWSLNAACYFPQLALHPSCSPAEFRKHSHVIPGTLGNLMCLPIKSQFIPKTCVYLYRYVLFHSVWLRLSWSRLLACYANQKLLVGGWGFCVMISVTIIIDYYYHY